MVTRKQKNFESESSEKAPLFVDGFDDTNNHSHFFNAYSILKLIFKKRGGDFVGRFHDTYPITVKNPITN